MRVTVIQLSPGHDLRSNMSAVETLVRDACAADHPRMVVLPEMWSCLGGTRGDKLDAAESLPEATGPDRGSGGVIYRFLATLASRHQIVLHGGSVGERVGDRLFNTSLVFGADGRERARYRKIHLFDIVTPNGDGYRESDTYEAGNEVVTFDAGGVSIGCSICYDLRFSGLFAALRDRGVELIAVPAAFTAETGAAHWDVLIRARAIETQCWIAAAATVGRHQDQHGATRSTFGHSMICDPWGTVVAQISPGVGWATAFVDRELTSRIRRDMPVWSHRTTLS